MGLQNTQSLQPLFKIMEYYKIQKDAVTKDEEYDIISLLPQSKMHGSGRNRILRYGSRQPYSSDMVSNLIPAVFKSLKLPFEFDSVTINEYYPGQLLDWHIDKPEGGKEVHVLNLVNEASLYFRLGKQILGVNLQPRELLTFGGELRYKWEHMVKPERYRISVVFRNSKNL